VIDTAGAMTPLCPNEPKGARGKVRIPTRVRPLVLNTIGRRSPTRLRDRALVQLLVGAGIRIDAVSQLRTNHYLTAGRVGYLGVVHPSPRTVRLKGSTKKDLERYLVRRGTATGTPLFEEVDRRGTSTGSPMCGKQIARKVQQLARRAGVQKLLKITR
jgi:site-specific recombinase XerC